MAFCILEDVRLQLGSLGQQQPSKPEGKKTATICILNIGSPAQLAPFLSTDHL